MKALVTGATGFIGSHLCQELVKRGYEITCLSRTSSNLKWIETLDIRLSKGDCTDRNSLLSAVEGVDYIFHLAGLTKATCEDDFFCINAKGTENLIKAVSERNPRLKRFVYLSSLAAAGRAEMGRLSVKMHCRLRCRAMAEANWKVKELSYNIGIRYPSPYSDPLLYMDQETETCLSCSR